VELKGANGQSVVGVDLENYSFVFDVVSRRNRMHAVLKIVRLVRLI
jgi:hypothetical protein